MALDLRRSTPAAIFLLIAFLLVSLLRCVSLSDNAAPLLPSNGWEKTEGFTAYRLALSPLEAPRSIVRSDALTAWRSWNPKDQGTIGELASRPFEIPDYIAIPYTGFPGEVAGNRIYLRCEANGAELPIATARTNTQWSTPVVDAREFCKGPARLIVSSADKQYYIGVTAPFKVSAEFYRAQTSFAPRALMVFATWALFVAASIVIIAHSQHRFPNIEPIAAAFVGVGLVGMLTIASFIIHRFAGYAFVAAAILGMIASLGSLWRSDRATVTTLLDRYRVSGLLWLAVALLLASFVSMIDNGAGAWAVNNIFSPVRWSTDNQLPTYLAEGLLRGKAAHLPDISPWMSSDRTPLMAGLLMFPRAIAEALSLVFGSPFIAVGYMMANIVILSSWVMLIPMFCRLARAPDYVLVTGLLFTSPFILFNTVYAWPKMLGAAYTVLAFLTLFRMREGSIRPRENLVVVALCAVLACLSHASNAFSLLPVAILFAPTIFRCGAPMIALATAAAVVTSAPWLYWQIFVEPRGNALIRYAFAGEFGFDIRDTPVLLSIAKAYQALSWSQWLAMKMAAMKLLLGIDQDWTRLPEVALYSRGIGWWGEQRALDFFSLARSIGIIGLGLLALAWSSAARRESANRFLIDAALAGAASIAAMVLVTIPAPWTHGLTYGAILLLALAGATFVATLPVAARWIMAAIASAYMLSVWIIPAFIVADRIRYSAGVGLLLAFAILILVVRQSRNGRAGAISGRPQTV